ncbi:hypothetical protein M0R19_01610 [Candidatus Pacearchaeota archaeon]|nr:hypothetical protein [Candidatus Pacearchaeota archaeon]
MRFNSRLSLKQFQGIFFFMLGGILIYSVYYLPETYRNWLFFFSISFISYGITICLEGIKQRHKISKATNMGEYDSNEEKKVAEYFTKKKIKFYVHPVLKVTKRWFIFDVPFKKVKLHPDFFLPEYNIYVEYWGLIEKEEYKKNNYDFKKRLYKENDLDVIDIYPKNLNNLDWDFTQKFMSLIRTKEGNNTFGKK